MFTRWLIFHVASGHSLFSGAACLIGAVCLPVSKECRFGRIVRNALVYLGATLVFVSATPLPPWFYFVLSVALLLWLTGEAFGGRIPARFALGLRVAVITLWLAAVLVEFPYHLSTTVPHLARPILGIIGDSVTAGMGESRDVTWPAILADRHGIPVRDHSRAGANTASALQQAASVSPDEQLLILEIGGNDILGESTPTGFEAGLTSLLSAVRRPGRVVVMLELPLPPTYNAYGRIQRRLARQYKTLLVPKRVLLGVLQQQDTTLDTIHLTRAGHEGMADAVWNVVRAAYENDR